jgi:dipeptidyl aminopeptidase/acylaminoacyl peptidase
MQRAGRLAALVLCLVVTACSGAAPPPPVSGLLTIDRLTEIKHPSLPTWSPDGAHVAFVWDQGGVQNLYLVASGGREAPRPLTSYQAGSVDNLFWSADGRTLYFVHDGDLWQVAPGQAGAPRPVWTTREVEDQVVPSPDGTEVAFVRGGQLGVPDWQRAEGDLYVRSLADGRETRLTSGQGVVAGPSWSPDGTRLAFTLTKVDVRSDAPDYSGAKILYTRTERQASVPAVVARTGGKVTTFAPSPGWEAIPSWLDKSHLLVQRVSADNRVRELAVVDLGTGRNRVLVREEDPKFWSVIAGAPVPSPDGQRVAFVSDRDGWDHLYVVPVDGGAPRQLTTGRFEVRNPAWSPDGARLAFDRNLEGTPGVRQLAVAQVAGDPVPVVELTSGRGTNTAPVWSRDGKRLAYQHTDPQTSAELFVVTAGTGPSVGVRLTDSMPAGVDRQAFVEPALVSYPAADGQKVPAYLFVPKGLDRTAKHPAVVWIHGDGINQNYDGWHVERNYAVYYSFHQYLLQHGYVVLAPDYRGSIGYGRDWRQAVYLDVGGKDAQDAASGADYLKTLPFVDAERIGVWGLSYGGFFTLVALTERPTTFRCGIDVAGVPDFGMWFVDPGGSWVTSRMGTPAEHPSVYDKAAPINRIGRLVRPLLILHGTADVNVPYVESVRLIDALLKAGKDFEFMVYPGEYHYFQRAHVLRDAWQRAEAFFDRHLKAPAAPSR